MSEDSRMTDSRVERLYDEYVDAALRGEVEDPAAFCARHGVDGTDLAQWLDALQEMVAVGDGSPSPSPDPDLPFERLGEYRLIRRLGEGGMGVVYLAEQPSLGRYVAIKVLRPELVGSGNAQARLRREAISAARLQHPSVVAIHG